MESNKQNSIIRMLANMENLPATFARMKKRIEKAEREDTGNNPVRTELTALHRRRYENALAEYNETEKAIFDWCERNKR